MNAIRHGHINIYICSLLVSISNGPKTTKIECERVCDRYIDRMNERTNERQATDDQNEMQLLLLRQLTFHLFTRRCVYFMSIRIHASMS